MAQVLFRKPSARRRIADVLAQEILNRPQPEDFAIASDHQLCRRFAVSRVTIRLALGDLEHKGLIYRRHGKGHLLTEIQCEVIAVLVFSPIPSIS